MPACSCTTKELYTVYLWLANAIKYTKMCLEAILLSSGKDSTWHPNRALHTYTDSEDHVYAFLQQKKRERWMPFAPYICMGVLYRGKTFHYTHMILVGPLLASQSR